MRSALRQAIDILGEDANSEDLVRLWCVISDLMLARSPKAWDDPAWEMAGGAERVRMCCACVIDASYLVDGTEPELVLRRLGLIRPLGRRAPAVDP